MPTTRLGKVYRLLKTQKAHIVSYEPFTIQLDYEPDTQVIQPMTLGVDSGAIHSGYSVANEHREYSSAEVIARNDISNRLSDRRMYRQSRRSRKTRYRQPRFKNRKNKKKGWLPPSLEQKVAVQVNEIDRMKSTISIATFLSKQLLLKQLNLIFKKSKIRISPALNTNKGLCKVITFAITYLKNMDANVFIVEKRFLILK